MFEEYEIFRKKFGYDQSFLKFANEIKSFLAEVNELESIEKSKVEKELLNYFEDKIRNTIVSPIENKSIIVGIRSGTGGEESKLFAQTMYDTYIRFCKYKKWNIEVLESSNESSVQFRVSGQNVYKLFRLESGIHRIQRVPNTEKSGRIHTSTIAIFIIPDIYNSSSIQILPSDIKIECFRSSGKGGQHVNKTESAVRITHIATGITASCQSGRNQIKNKEEAMENLKRKLYLFENEKILQSRQLSIDSQVKNSDRGDKIRTYNFKQDRITDHRTNDNFSGLEEYFKGEEKFSNILWNVLLSYEKYFFLNK